MWDWLAALPNLLERSWAATRALTALTGLKSSVSSLLERSWATTRALSGLKSSVSWDATAAAAAALGKNDFNVFDFEFLFETCFTVFWCRICFGWFRKPLETE